MRNVVSNKDPWYIPPEELKKFSRIRNENPRQSRAHDDAHHDRVRDRCKIIAREIIDQEDIKLDLQALSLAATLHDIDQPYDNKRNHAELSAVKAGNMLEKLKYSHGMIEKVQSIIREHSSENGTPPTIWEGKILFDADKLDGLGVIGIQRVFDLCRQIGLTEEETIEWYERKIEKALPLMQTSIAREMGKEDLEYTLTFIAEFKKKHMEAGGGEGETERNMVSGEAVPLFDRDLDSNEES